MKFQMKNSIRNEILFLNISLTFTILLIIFFVILNIFQNNILDNVIKKMIKNSQESQIYIMDTLKNFSFEDVYFQLEELSPFLADYISNKYNLRVQLYNNKKRLLFDTAFSNKKYFVYQDIHYASNNMKNYIIKKYGKEKILFFSSPILFKNEVIGVIRFIYPMNNEFRIINSIARKLIFLDFIAIIFVILLNYYFSNSIVRPIKKLKLETEKIANGNFDSRIYIKSNDEINSLVNSFNKMAENLEKYIYSLKEEKEKQKMFIDNVTHELKTPITSILGHAELVKRLKNKEDINKSLDYILSEGHRLLDMVEEVLYLSKINKNSFDFEFSFIRIEELINDVISLLNPRFKKFGIKIIKNFKEELLCIDYLKIKEVLLNILDNSIKHSKCTEIFISSYKELNYYCLVISDNGIGIDEKIKKEIFQPFISSKGKNSFGLGLTISKEIMAKHNGEIQMESSNTGTKIVLKFPLDKKRCKDNE
ncbi:MULTISPECIES: HAMP domain-containing sensor histidine kinase [unclassified Marinitoga]|uniref:sensor histidine kinase n=1 Tax=unclassified Marinitoga TaxID=2640159 RepID=UPI0015866677|nr:MULTISPECIES: HAMP domain-containing sensor histidine kinase [unclassified Marinitoga]